MRRVYWVREHRVFRSYPSGQRAVCCAHSSSRVAAPATAMMEGKSSTVNSSGHNDDDSKNNSRGDSNNSRNSSRNNAQDPQLCLTKNAVAGDDALQESAVSDDLVPRHVRVDRRLQLGQHRRSRADIVPSRRTATRTNTINIHTRIQRRREIPSKNSSEES